MDYACQCCENHTQIAPKHNCNFGLKQAEIIFLISSFQLILAICQGQLSKINFMKKMSVANVFHITHWEDMYQFWELWYSSFHEG